MPITNAYSRREAPNQNYAFCGGGGSIEEGLDAAVAVSTIESTITVADGFQKCFGGSYGTIRSGGEE